MPAALGGKRAHRHGARRRRQADAAADRDGLRTRFLKPCVGFEARWRLLPAVQGPLAMTTDSYVVRPLFFPGGSIGHLAVFGTVNDLAMCGAEPLYLSAGFILEEGLELDRLRAIVADMREAASRCGVSIVTGDTKVVERGKGDGVFINTSGVGVIRHAVAPARMRLETPFG